MLEYGVALIISALGSGIGAFVGFFLGAAKQRDDELKSIKTKKHKALLSIASELSIIRNDIMYDDYFIPLTNWDALRHSGIILELLDLDFYEDIISIYSRIQLRNDTISSNTKNRIDSKDIIKIYDKLFSNREFKKYIQSTPKIEIEVKNYE